MYMNGQRPIEVHFSVTTVGPRVVWSVRYKMSSLFDFQSYLENGLDTLISQVDSDDIDIGIGALLQLNGLIEDEKKQFLLISRVDKLLEMLNCQHQRICKTAVINGEMSSKEADLLRENIVVTQLIVCSRVLIMEATEPIEVPLGSLISNIISFILADEFVKSDEQVGFYNQMLAVLVDGGNHNSCVIALVSLLQQFVESQCSVEFIDTVIKCLRKIGQTLLLLSPSVADQVDLQDIFWQIQEFFDRFPMRYWSDQPSDTPMRAVKTLLSTLVTLRGIEVLDDITMIKQPQTSEVVAYLTEVLVNSGMLPIDEAIGGRTAA